jgi:hypothetical protein
MKVKIILIAILILVSCGVANATSISNWGPTGIMEIPTADVLGFGIGTAPNIALSSYVSSGQGYTLSLIRLPFTLGLGDGLEFGITDITISTDEPGIPESSGAVFHGKISLIEEKSILPGIAIGGVFDPSNILGENSFYLVISKGIGNLRGHIGMGNGIYDGIFWGVEFNITKDMEVVTFYKSQDIGFGLKLDILPSVSIGMSYYGGLTLQIATSVTL